MDKLIVRSADAGDINAITEMEQICFSTPWSRESIAHDLTENPMAQYLVAELDGTIAGYGGMWVIVDEGHITNVAVLPQYRNKKIATLIMAVMLTAGERHGIHRFTLEVRSSNEAAKALYRKLDFKEEGLRKGYYQDTGEDAIIMWRDPSEPLKN